MTSIFNEITQVSPNERTQGLRGHCLAAGRQLEKLQNIRLSNCVSSHETTFCPLFPS